LSIDVRELNILVINVDPYEMNRYKNLEKLENDVLM